MSEKVDITGQFRISWDGVVADPSEPRTNAGIPVRALRAWVESEGYRLIGPSEAAALEARNLGDAHEELTPEDREDIEADIRDAFAFHQTGRGDPPNVSAVIAAKLLRIHDQQAARIEELERQLRDEAWERSERE